MGDHNFQALRRAILKLSQATDWETACKEWALTDIYESEEDQTCLCEKFPIREVCAIRNTVTGHSTEVGNVCVKRFLGINSNLIFDAVKRVRKDETKSLNADAIVFFNKSGILTAWEYGFLNDTKGKRNLSAAQLAKRIEINQRVLAIVAQRGLKGYTPPTN